MKTAAEVYMPCSGKVLKVNSALEDEPQIIGEDAEQNGWLMEMQIDDLAELDELLDADAYTEYLKTVDEDH